ncbi:MAG: tRNA (N6-threonylcarbamoyladenosine(37)-N6)-methyltransferase TrmO [Synergistaceae bacterium]|nr:tRNA (N6-threonylcarbamoyladenosine(37)-N6)-methyltransferase TrmO [Synergistaceae bacterium]
MKTENMDLRPVGRVHSPLKRREDCPSQGCEDAPGAEIEIFDDYLDCLDGLEAGREILILTWLHLSNRDLRKVHPRGNREAPLRGIFATRSPARPNPIGLHRVRLVEKKGGRLKVEPLEALDGTPVIDIKPVLGER